MQRVLKRTRQLRAHNEILKPASMVLGTKQLDRLKSCGETWVEVNRIGEGGGLTTVWRQLHCSSRYCPICASRESYKRSGELKDRFEHHGASRVSLLATITVGAPVAERALALRRDQLHRVWVKLWPVLKAAGCRGGVYSYEATASPSNPELTHLHMHLWLDWDATSWMIEKDTRWCLTRRADVHDFTPAWLQWMAWVERAMQKATPDLWERLRPTEECWKKGGRYAHARRVAALSGVDCPARFVSVDLGGRFPGRPGTRARQEGRWVPLTLLDQNPKEALKYALKGMSGRPAGAMMRLFQGHRRAQPFGIYARAEKAESEEPLTEPEVPSLRRLTGRVLAFVAGGIAISLAEMIAHTYQAWGMSKRVDGLEVRLKLVYAGPRYCVWQWVDAFDTRVNIQYSVA